MHGTVDEKTDVFSFGVLLLEIITGRQALDDSQQSLVFWVLSSCQVSLPSYIPYYLIHEYILTIRAYTCSTVGKTSAP